VSTYYQFRCPVHEEQGGFFSRQVWGCGNFDIFDNARFLFVHKDCGTIEILSEHNGNYSDHVEEKKWSERVLRDIAEDPTAYCPHSGDWELVQKGIDTEGKRWSDPAVEELAEEHRKNIEWLDRHADRPE